MSVGASGTDGKGDCKVTVELGDEGLNIEVESTVEYIFGDKLKEEVKDALSELKVKNAKVRIVDKGALDYVIKARVESAVLKAKGE